MRVAFLGLGIMGSRMAANLVRAGFEVTVWNRTTEKAEAFSTQHQAALARTPAEAAARAEAVVTMVVDGAQVERLLLGDDGVASAASDDLLCVDCSTIGPTPTRTIGAALAEHEIGMVDAPVTGSAPRAEDGTLTIMAGGAPEDFQRASPLLEAMGEVIIHVGALGDGQLVKLLNNAVAATNAATVAQALVFGARAGIDLDALVDVMRNGSAASTMLELKAQPMREHDYRALFKLDHMLKDLRLCLEEGQILGAPFPYAALTRETLTAAASMGHGEDDFASLLEPLERAAGTRL
jgi:3-hydroxyisobutyrate dehydrogenase-like beta-hydroxyacid dehydrogenase